MQTYAQLRLDLASALAGFLPPMEAHAESMRWFEEGLGRNRTWLVAHGGDPVPDEERQLAALVMQLALVDGFDFICTTGGTGVASDSNTIPSENFTFSTMVIPAAHEGPSHLHTDVEEVFFVMRGKLKLVLEKDGERFETILTDRDVVSVPPGSTAKRSMSVMRMR